MQVSAYPGRSKLDDRIRPRLVSEPLKGVLAIWNGGLGCKQDDADEDIRPKCSGECGTSIWAGDQALGQHPQGKHLSL